MTNDNEQTGPGRPRLRDDEPTVKFSISMPESYRDWLHEQDRSTSQAIRTLIEAEMARQMRKGQR